MSMDRSQAPQEQPARRRPQYPSAAYARYRPHYPADLFPYLASLAPGRDLAWDCGTGNGQAAVGLAPYFARVVATDASEKQIAHAARHAKVRYHVVPAEKTELESASVDLLTVAQAVHWFNHEAFYAEARRVLRPGGVIAVWTYTLPETTAAVDQLVQEFFHDKLGTYWEYGRHFVDERYETLPFPFPEIEPPHFEMGGVWGVDDVIGYLTSWSARQKYMAEHGDDPLDEYRERIAAAWGDAPELRPVRWPLYFRIGRAQEGG